jgi:hypothetical protein
MLTLDSEPFYLWCENSGEDRQVYQRKMAGATRRTHLVAAIRRVHAVRHKVHAKPLKGLGSRVSRAIAGPHGEADDAQSFGQSRTLRIKQLLGLTGATGWFDLAVPARLLCTR